MKLWNKFIEKNDEWYTPKETVDLMFNLMNIPKNSTIICPFDTNESHFVKQGLKNHKVIYGVRDWLNNNYEYDYLITNPPFSIKDKVIEKCLESGKPSMLLLPIDSLGGVRRHELYKKYNYPSIYIPSRRIGYVSPDGLLKKGAYFHSIMLYLNDPLGSRLIWE